MKKKNILFIEEGLGIGGAEKSLLTILNLIDYDKYDIDLFLFRHDGEFNNDIPSKVNLLKESDNYKIFSQNRKLAPLRFLLKLDFVRTYHSICWLINVVISKVRKEKLYIGWNHIKYFFDNIEKEYDTSIAFLERKTIYFNVDKVKSKNKIGFIHNDYSIYPYDDKLDRVYFNYYNKIATVSEHCKEVLDRIFPEYEEKFLVIKNMVSRNLIQQLAKEKIKNYIFEEGIIKIVTVGRLVNQKGIDNAIIICKKLINENKNIKWYVIGTGDEKEFLKKQIKKLELENNFFLVGADTNPYKWMNIADIYVQPSRFEGFGITVAEAKSLNKPIVASDIPEFNELLDNERLGLTAKDNSEFIRKIQLLIKDKELKNKLEENLINENDSLEELYKLYKII